MYFTCAIKEHDALDCFINMYGFGEKEDEETIKMIAMVIRQQKNILIHKKKKRTIELIIIKEHC